MEIFKGKLILSGIFTTFSGLNVANDRMGCNNSSMVRTIVRHPVSKEPFIPGSVFKGAVRRLLQKEDLLAGGNASIDNESYWDNSVYQIFGISGRQATTLTTSLPGRAVFRDAFLTKECQQQLAAKKQLSYLTEIRIQAGMDRVTSQVEAVMRWKKYRLAHIYNLPSCLPFIASKTLIILSGC